MINNSYDTMLSSIMREIAVRNGSKSYNVRRAGWLRTFNNNFNFNANDRNINNNNRLRGIAQHAETLIVNNPPRCLWLEICRHSNLELAFRKARKHKTLKPYVKEFENNLKENLVLLRMELLLHAYKPTPLQMFILHDPKTRKISKSVFRDRVVHHALCNVIEPIFERGFIYDSYANRLGKGTLKAVERYEYFQRKVTRNNCRVAFVLKADIRHYFDTVDQVKLLQILQKKVHDPRILWLIKCILANYCTSNGKGMPLGNLTSQFFANVYLNELDRFVKQNLKARYYVRYVDDFIIMHHSPTVLQEWKEQIAEFLKQDLLLELHPEKSKIIFLFCGVDFLGFKVFNKQKLLKKRNIRTFLTKVDNLDVQYKNREIGYDKVYDIIEGWCAYACHADTFTRRQRVLSSFEKQFPKEISTKEVNRYLKYTKCASRTAKQE